MELLGSIQRIAETVGVAPDTILTLFAWSWFVYVVCDAIVTGLVVWGVFHGLTWLLNMIGKHTKRRR